MVKLHKHECINLLTFSFVCITSPFFFFSESLFHSTCFLLHLYHLRRLFPSLFFTLEQIKANLSRIFHSQTFTYLSIHVITSQHFIFHFLRNFISTIYEGILSVLHNKYLPEKERKIRWLLSFVVCSVW